MNVIEIHEMKLTKHKTGFCVWELQSIKLDGFNKPVKHWRWVLDASTILKDKTFSVDRDRVRFPRYKWDQRIELKEIHIKKRKNK